MAGTRATAGEQLDRLLHILPVSAREEGCRLDELAHALGTTVAQVVHDLEEVTARAYYHPAGGADNLQILIDGDRVQIWTTGEFRRPLRLSPLEALALALGFRVLAAEQDPSRRSMLLATASRIEAQAATGSAEQLVEGFAIDPGDGGGTEVLTALRQAARDRRQCRIEYLKPNGPRAEPRVIHPYALARADAGRYALAYCTGRGGVRAFRMDRVLSARQAKRWEGTVGRPEIQKFVGALQGQRARRGIFITTSSFTKEAVQYTSMIENKVVLIDGEMLAKLMIDHGVGVSAVATYEVKRVDTDYFSV